MAHVPLPYPPSRHQYHPGATSHVTLNPQPTNLSYAGSTHSTKIPVSIVARLNRFLQPPDSIKQATQISVSTVAYPKPIIKKYLVACLKASSKSFIQKFTLSQRSQLSQIFQKLRRTPKTLCLNCRMSQINASYSLARTRKPFLHLTRITRKKLSSQASAYIRRKNK